MIPRDGSHTNPPQGQTFHTPALLRTAPTLSVRSIGNADCTWCNSDWGRAVCLEELKRLTKAREAVADLIEEVGTGATATQRGYVAQAYLLQARTAEARGRFDEAFKAIEAAIAQCSGGNDPELMTMRQEAEHAQQALQWRVRSAR